VGVALIKARHTHRLPSRGRLLHDDEVRHATWKNRPQASWREEFDFFDGHAERNQLLHCLVQSSPLVAVPVETGVGEAVATSAIGLELVGEFSEHVVNLLAVIFDALRVENDRVHNAFTGNVIGRVLFIFEEAVQKDFAHTICCKNTSVSAHQSLSPHRGKLPGISTGLTPHWRDTR